MFFSAVLNQDLLQYTQNQLNTWKLLKCLEGCVGLREGNHLGICVLVLFLCAGSTSPQITVSLTMLCITVLHTAISEFM